MYAPSVLAVFAADWLEIIQTSTTYAPSVLAVFAADWLEIIQTSTMYAPSVLAVFAADWLEIMYMILENTARTVHDYTLPCSVCSWSYEASTKHYRKRKGRWRERKSTWRTNDLELRMRGLWENCIVPTKGLGVKSPRPCWIYEAGIWYGLLTWIYDVSLKIVYLEYCPRGEALQAFCAVLCEVDCLVNDCHFSH